MYATLFLLTLSGPQLAPCQFPGTQHPTVWYYNSHNVPMPWPANSYFTLTMNGTPPGAALTGDKVILPVLRTAAPKVRVVITTGVRIPEGAEKL